jgi:hypothetical protein
VYNRNVVGSAVAFLQKCTPFGVREIGFGFNPDTGSHSVLLQLKQLSYEQVGVAWRFAFIMVVITPYEPRSLDLWPLTNDPGQSLGRFDFALSLDLSKSRPIRW